MQNAVSLSQAVTHEIPFRRLWLAPQSLVFFRNIDIDAHAHFADFEWGLMSVILLGKSLP